MRLTFAADFGQDLFQIDAVQLQKEVAANGITVGHAHSQNEAVFLLDETHMVTQEEVAKDGDGMAILDPNTNKVAVHRTRVPDPGVVSRLRSLVLTHSVNAEKRNTNRAVDATIVSIEADQPITQRNLRQLILKLSDVLKASTGFDMETDKELGPVLRRVRKAEQDVTSERNKRVR